MKICKLLAFLPVPSLVRGSLYRILVGHHGKIGVNFKIGYASYIDAQNINIGNYVTIGNMVRIKYLDCIKVGDHSSIGSNTIVCGARKENKYLDCNLIIGDKTQILCSHYFDVVAPVIIGSNVIIAGKWTQLYTHSFDLNGNRVDAPIIIGNYNYIGAGCILNLGITTCNNVVLQSGTCLNQSITESGVYMSNYLMRRGNVRNYSELFETNDNYTLSSGKKVFKKYKF